VEEESSNFTGEEGTFSNDRKDSNARRLTSTFSKSEVIIWLLKKKKNKLEGDELKEKRRKARLEAGAPFRGEKMQRNRGMARDVQGMVGDSPVVERKDGDTREIDLTKTY